MPGGNRGSSPSAIYPTHCKIPSPDTGEKRTERHLYTFLWVEDDRRVILGTVTGEHGVDRGTLTLYGISDNGTGDDE